MFVYLLQSTNGNTYIGATTDLDRRLRQHNKEIKGGAVATGIKVSQGETWSRIAYIDGLPDWRTTLQVEWRWKQLSRKYPMSLPPLNRRMNALKDLLSLDRPTSKAMAYTEWTTPPKICFETEEAEQLYNSIAKKEN